MTEDAKKLVRDAQPLIVEIRRGSGSPPNFGGWELLWGAKVERIEINAAGTPSIATVWFPERRWHEQPYYNLGDSVRIKTDVDVIVFDGFITSLLPSFTGGRVSPSIAFERNAFAASSYRWLYASTSPVYGRLARGLDDYEDGEPVAGSVIFLSGQRTIFNEDGRPNCDPVLYEGGTCDTPVFADSDRAVYWTAKDMLRYILSPSYNRIYQYWPIENPNELSGLDHKDWQKVLTHIAVEGLSVIAAVELICRHIGWSFREDYSGDSPELVFYKPGAASGYTRSDSNPTILHQLYAPDVGNTIDAAVSRGEKLLYAMELAKDITSVINNPWGLGAPHRFEFTAELVPAWLDERLEPDTSDGNINLFITESDLQALTDKNEKSFYKHYHSRGSEFRRNVGRKWVLNESGRYSNPDTYNRGHVFDFAEIVPEEYIIDTDSGKRLFAPLRRQLLLCLTLDKDSLNSVGIKVEFCFNGDEENPEDRIWQVIPAAISSLKDEYGIYIDEANLSELVDEAEGTITEGVLADIQLNYWTSLCDDILNERPFFDEEGQCQWRTRCRVTASVQLDQRLWLQVAPSPASGSPFLHTQLYDFSEKYGLLKRTAASRFTSADPPMSAYELDSTDYFGRHLEAIRRANEDRSISGQFTLDRLWLGSACSPQPDFAIGDCIKEIKGREYDLSANLGGEGSETKVYPEIIQIIHSCEHQKTKIITRDLRFAEVLL